MKPLDRFLNEAVGRVFPTAVLHINHAGQTVYTRAVGWVDPDTRQQPATLDTLFDLASVTKLFTTTAFLRLVAAGKVGLDDPVCGVLPEFVGKRPFRPYEDPLNPGHFVTVAPDEGVVDASRTTFRQLLTHSSGLPAWRPLYQQAREEIRPFVLHTFFSYPPNTRVVYSDLGLIMLGWAIEALTEQPLAQAISALVLQPLAIDSVLFNPPDPGRCAPTEFCRWRNRRMQGEVHDENAWQLGGVAGHAGLFGTAVGVVALGQAWLDVVQGRSDFLPRGLAETAVSLQTQDGDTRRGLGWALWSPYPLSPSHPLGPRTFGHTGFTGTSLFMDPDRDLVIACLTNEVYAGREDRGIAPFRVAYHQKIVHNL